MNEEKPTVFIIDDDVQILKYLSRLVQSIGFDARTFVSADEFLKSDTSQTPCCMILDVRMPGLSGMDLQERLRMAGKDIPVIFLTGYGTVPLSVKAMKDGAFDFLEKPFDDQALLDAVNRAVERNRRVGPERRERNEIQVHLKSLTEREREVFDLVVEGHPNKYIAQELGVSEKTVKVHRSRVMHKMGAFSLADLVKMAQKITAERSKV
jgi:RNA polymerase sigma factor (sigma-70 family)